MNTNEHCSGCVSNSCGSDQYNDKGQCPCTKCVVKMMCKKACYDFLLFRLATNAVLHKQKEKVDAHT